jgi:hypothetical protein
VTDGESLQGSALLWVKRCGFDPSGRTDIALPLNGDGSASPVKRFGFDPSACAGFD